MPKDGSTELEPTDDGKYIVTARWIQRARQAFLNGDIDPLLELVDFHGDYGDPENAVYRQSPFHGNLLFSPRLAQLINDALTGKIKRPRGQGAKKIHMSRASIMAVGDAIDGLRAKGSWVTREDAIKMVADGSPAIEGLEGLEGLEIPKVPKDRIERIYEEYQRIMRAARSPKKTPRKKPTTTTHSRPTRSPSTTSTPRTKRSSLK